MGDLMDRMVRETFGRLRDRDEAHIRSELARLGIPVDEAAERVHLRIRFGSPEPPEVVEGPPPGAESELAEDEHQRWVSILSAVARDDEGLSDALDRLVAVVEDDGDDLEDARSGWETERAADDAETVETLRNGQDHIARAQRLLFELFPQLNDDEEEKTIPREAIELRSVLSEAGLYADAAISELERRRTR